MDKEFVAHYSVHQNKCFQHNSLLQNQPNYLTSRYFDSKIPGIIYEP